MAASSLAHAMFLLFLSMGVLGMRDYLPASVKGNVYFARLSGMVGVDGSVTMVAAVLALVWSSASVMMYLVEFLNRFRGSKAAMSSVYVSLDTGVEEKPESSGPSFKSIRAILSALQGSSYENQSEEQGNLDVSGIFTDNEGENLEKKGELVSLIPAGKWVKENNKDWKVVERMKTQMDLLLNFPNKPEEVCEIPAEETTQEIDQVPVEETTQEIDQIPCQPESLVLPPIKGDPVVFCLANCELKLLRGGNLLLDSNYLKARRDMWIERYKKNARMVCDAVNEAIGGAPDSRAVSRGEIIHCRLERFAKYHPELLIAVTILSLLLTILMGIGCYMDEDGGTVGRLEELVMFVLRAIGTRLQNLMGKA